MNDMAESGPAPDLPLDVRHVKEGFLFSLSWASRAVAVGRCVVGCITIFLSLAPGALGLGWRLASLVLGVLVTSWGLGAVRSKVLADPKALHQRTMFGWRELQWSTIVGLQVGDASTRFGIYPIWVVRTRRRALRPLALASDSLDEATAKAELLRSIAPGVALIQ